MSSATAPAPSCVLFERSRPSRHRLLEAAVEAIEDLGSFSLRQIHERTGGGPTAYGAAVQAIRELEQRGLIRRTSEPNARPTIWQVAA